MKPRPVASTNSAASLSAVKQRGQGRVKDPSRYRRIAENRKGPTGQGQVKDQANDKRLAKNKNNTLLAKDASTILRATGGLPVIDQVRQGRGSSRTKQTTNALPGIGRLPPAKDA